MSEESDVKTNPTLIEEVQSWRDEADRSQPTVSGRIESWREESERQAWQEEPHQGGGAHHSGGGVAPSGNDPWAEWFMREDAQPAWVPRNMAIMEGARSDAEGRQDAWSQHATIPQTPSRKPGAGVAVTAQRPWDEAGNGDAKRGGPEVGTTTFVGVDSPAPQTIPGGPAQAGVGESPGR